MSTFLAPNIAVRSGLAGRADADGEMLRLERMKKACSGVESIFAAELLKSLEKGVAEGGMFGDAPGADILGSLFTQQLAVHLSESNNRGMGLGQALYNQMLVREDLQEIDSAAPDLGGLEYRRIISPNLAPDNFFNQ